MKTDLNIDAFLNYASSTGKYNAKQMDAIEEALNMLEDECSKLSWKEYGLYSVDYITDNLTKCCKKITGFMMVCGMKEAKATEAAKDFKKWFKLYD